MKIRKREIARARAGIFGTKDDPKYVTNRDIKEIAETFAGIKTAPVQFGHSSNAADPRLGAVVSVYSDSEGNTLYADIEETDVLSDAVDSGYYPDVSIGAKQRAGDGKMYLHHLAYLGQESPAVKNMIAEIKEPLGIAAADAEGLVIFPLLKDFQMNLSEPVRPKKEDCTVTKEEAEKLRAENGRLKEELEKRDLALSDSQEKKREADIERLKAAMNGAGTPIGLQERFIQIAGVFDPGKSIELSDASGGKKSINPVDALIQAVSAIPPPVQTGALKLSDHDNGSHNGRDFSRLRNKG